MEALDSLAAEVVFEAVERGLTFGTAESCTGGMVAAAITSVAGSSAAFLGSVVSYSDSVKTELLGVDQRLLAEKTAVSSEVAAAMAEGLRTRVGCDIAVSVTGIAGPDGATADKPVGLVWFAVAGRGDTQTVARTFEPISRQSVREQATAFALELLRDAIRE